MPGTDLRIHVAVPAKTPTPPRHRGMKVHEYTIAPEQIGRIDTFLVVRPERLFLELSAALPRIDLIVAGDQMLRRELTDSDSLRGFLSQCYRRRGVQRARAAVPHLEKNADSPPETRLRMLLVDAGLPRPVANQDVHNGWGVWLAKPDLSYPAQKIAIQYEGGHHREDPRQYSYDIERDGRLIDLGWIVIRVDKEMLYKHPEQVINRVRRSLSRGVSGHHAA
ncbi:endonuclease domain-containing protein [Actinomadura alba]|uniref:DUF559 domain-containing protein n=1 Tax=Actinomadura alba TaxID=406431 RepID=A0ABR7LK49_9ACTN|nr:DUF559 domain-containing protein [Actinomadura alba]MBC6465230.1 DUF559 domain-containing protein [Actinomadura alba]